MSDRNPIRRALLGSPTTREKARANAASER